jgi:hypothetical protein
MALYKYLILHKIIVRYMPVVKFQDFSPSGISVHFILYRKNKIKRVRKNSGRLVTLCDYPNTDVELKLLTFLNFLYKK